MPIERHESRTEDEDGHRQAADVQQHLGVAELAHVQERVWVPVGDWAAQLSTVK